MEEIVEKFNPNATALLGEVEEKLVFYLKAGHSLSEAAKLAGANRVTLTQWLQKGADPKTKASIYRCPSYIHVEPYYSFARRIRAAEAIGKQHVLPRRPSGFPPKEITPEQRAAILDALRQGWSYHKACRAAGISLRTFVSYLHRGGYPQQVSMAHPIREEDRVEPYVSFVKDVLRAEEQFFTG